MTEPFKLSSMKCIDFRIVIGTNTGIVGILDAQNHQVIQVLRCHQDKVLHLVSLPSQLASNMCAEIPFTNCANTKTTKADTGQSHYTSNECDNMIATIGTGRHNCVFNSNRDITANNQDCLLQANEILLQLWKTVN